MLTIIPLPTTFMTKEKADWVAEMNNRDDPDENYKVFNSERVDKYSFFVAIVDEDGEIVYKL